jgi:hypothetical protein
LKIWKAIKNKLQPVKPEIILSKTEPARKMLKENDQNSKKMEESEKWGKEPGILK